MVFAPTIQTFNGLQAAHPGTTGVQCAIDWGNDRLWMNDATNLSRHTISTGAQAAYVLTSTIPNYTTALLGWDNTGNIYMPVNTTLYNGGLSQINGTSLVLIQTANMAAPHFTSDNVVQTGGIATMVGSNPGNAVITSNNSTNYTSGGSYLLSQGWGTDLRGKVCSGADGSGISWLFTSPGDPGPTQQVTVNKVDAFGTKTTVGVIPMASISGSFTTIGINALCVDQTDGNPIGIFTGNGDNPKLAKISQDDASVMWVAGSPVVSDSAGSVFSQSRIRNNRLGVLNKSPNGIVIYDTTDGSTVDAYFTGMSGINIIGPQCYDDTLGAVILCCQYNTTVGGPSPLNGSTTGFTGWAILYVADAIVPATPIIPGAYKTRVWGNMAQV
jgi:hypothetical protein